MGRPVQKPTFQDVPWSKVMAGVWKSPLCQILPGLELCIITCCRQEAVIALLIIITTIMIKKSSSPLSCGSIVSQIRMLHRESVSRATDRPSCSFLSHLFLAWISGSLNTLTFWWQWCRSWKWSDLTRRKGISCHQKIQCNRPPWWPYDPPRLCFLRNHDYTSSSFCQFSFSWYFACRLRFPLESGTYLFFCTSEKPLNSVDLIIVILDMI